MKLNHVTLLVSSIEKSKEFYKQILGIESYIDKTILGEKYSKVTGFQDLKLRFCALRIPGSDAVLEFAQILNPSIELRKDFSHVAFEVDDIMAVYSKAKIYAVSEPVVISGQGKGLDGKKFFYFKDPDGNLIEIIEAKADLYTK
jgi:catechol 2,3-dioxygenase-like lactoylglutathione lyase family enzyme